MDDGWWDDPGSRDYNRAVATSHPDRHERLWRDDGVYDLLVEIGYNDDPPRAGRGSAIFLHVARPGYLPTEGCVALAMEDLRAALRMCDPRTSLRIDAGLPRDAPEPRPPRLPAM